MADAPRLLVTGASGQLARRVAEIALESVPPERLILVTRRPEALAELARRGVDVRFADFARPESLPAAFAGAGRVLLVSATDLAARAEQHRAAIDAAVAAGVEQLIYTSALAPEPPNPAVVAPSHYATEQHLARAGVPYTLLRNSLYSEERAADAERAGRAGTLVHNRGDGRSACKGGRRARFTTARAPRRSAPRIWRGSTPSSPASRSQPSRWTTRRSSRASSATRPTTII